MIYPAVLVHAVAFIPQFPKYVLGLVDGWGLLFAGLTILVPFYLFALLAWRVAARISRGEIGSLAEGLLLAIPLFGSGYRRRGQGIFLRALGFMWRAGIPARQALTETIESCPSPRLAEALRSARGLVEKGESLSRMLAESGGFSPETVACLDSAEKAGKTDEELLRQAGILLDSWRRTLDATMKTLPWVVYLIGAGFIAYRIITAVSSYTSTINSLM